ncbi:MinD/ParA family protein (plasmid) [Mycolicibacterium crocinum]|uniref:MinD/ParA family protein n=1 Tax=Mycolicibacterium crocinum TaxID=388459 RepID=A0ABY3TTN5_9MYCO|nr:MinD/ParA family protein [Mycolicibacterium crocinum]ULN44729.1 MinD/ParA family protein [Mycolicibacterium crocinum]
MSMDPEFTARYLNEQDPDESPPGRSLDQEVGIGADPQVPEAPSLPEPEAPPYQALPDNWAETTQVVAAAPIAVPPPAARVDEQNRSLSAPARAAEGVGEYRETGARTRDPGADYTERRRLPQAPATPPRGFAGPGSADVGQALSGPMARAADEFVDYSQGPAAAHRPPSQPFSAAPPRVPAAPNNQLARSEAAPVWDASGSSFAHASNAPALRAEDVVAARKLPPEMGWRKAVHLGSAKTINLGAGPTEQRLRDQIDLIKTNIPGNYLIGVVSIRGGVGKTRTTAGVGTAYAIHRKNEPVLAIDANPTYGALGRLIDPTATASIREFLADNNLHSYPMARHYTGKNKPGLEVLAANQNVTNPFDLSPEAFQAVLGRVRRFYQLALVDCGPEIEHPVMQAVLSSVDSLLIVGTMNFDGAAAAETTIKWLAARSEYQALLRRSALVLNDVYDCADKDFMAKVRETIGQRVGGVTSIPWDKHLRDSPQLDWDALRRETQYAYLGVAAWLAQGFRSGRTALR